MTGRALAAAVLLGAMLAPGGTRADEPPAEVSEPTQTKAEAWKSPGFRLSLGFGYGRLVGLGGAPSGRLLGPMMRAGIRLDEHWSLLGSFQYLSASADGGLSGLRYTGLLEPTLHVTDNLSVGVGLGFGGIVEGGFTGRFDPDEPPSSTLTDSYTFPDASMPLAECSGGGVAARVRADWMFLLGRHTAMGLALELDAQWTGCVDDTGRVEDDTAEPIVRRQFWPHVGGTISWLVKWR